MKALPLSFKNENLIGLKDRYGNDVMRRFDSILVANRGEIACRILRTAQKLGYKTIAIYSDPDAESPHVQLANQAIRIGPGPVAESYLVPELVIQAALESGAGAVHPGYGFLSENAAFADACVESGLIFIGPTSDAIAIMGAFATRKAPAVASKLAVVA